MQTAGALIFHSMSHSFNVNENSEDDHKYPSNKPESAASAIHRGVGCCGYYPNFMVFEPCRAFFGQIRIHI